jgi:cytochrome P450
VYQVAGLESSDSSPLPPGRPDWDPLAPPALDDPVSAMAELREHCPVAWTERAGGFWAVTRYDDIREATRDPETFINGGGPQWGKPRPPLEVDRPLHTHFRRLLQPYFHRKRNAELEPRVRGYVAEMLQPLLGAGGGDLAPALTYPLPARVLAAFLNLPDGAWAVLKEWSEELYENEEGRGGDLEKVQAASRRFYGYAADLVAERKADPLPPDEDIVSGLLVADGVTEDDVVQVLRLLLTAGHNSTTSALGICSLAVARDAEVQRRLRDDPTLIPSAVDEFMRLETPVMAMPRWASCDTELGGRAIAAGDQLFLVWQSGNRDRAFWGESADECVLDRAPNPHLVFGHGLHRCIGDVVALLELRVTLEELLSRTSWIELAGEPVRTTWVRYGVSRLPLRVR